MLQNMWNPSNPTSASSSPNLLSTHIDMWCATIKVLSDGSLWAIMAPSQPGAKVAPLGLSGYGFLTAQSHSLIWCADQKMPMWYWSLLFQGRECGQYWYVGMAWSVSSRCPETKRWWTTIVTDIPCECYWRPYCKTTSLLHICNLWKYLTKIFGYQAKCWLFQNSKLWVTKKVTIHIFCQSYKTQTCGQTTHRDIEWRQTRTSPQTLPSWYADVCPKP